MLVASMLCTCSYEFAASLKPTGCIALSSRRSAGAWRGAGLCAAHRDRLHCHAGSHRRCSNSICRPGDHDHGTAGTQHLHVTQLPQAAMVSLCDAHAHCPASASRSSRRLLSGMHAALLARIVCIGHAWLDSCSRAGIRCSGWAAVHMLMCNLRTSLHAVHVAGLVDFPHSHVSGGLGMILTQGSLSAALCLP